MADVRRRFDVSLVTPEGPAFEGEAEMLIVPGAAGEIGVLARHAPLVAMLKAGSTRVHTGSEVLEFATGPGFFKVETDRALALVDDAVRADDVDSERANRQPGGNQFASNAFGSRYPSAGRRGGSAQLASRSRRRNSSVSNQQTSALGVTARGAVSRKQLGN